MKDFDNHFSVAWWALKIGLGIGPIITGIDKYFNKLTDWGMYLGPMATEVIPVSATTFMHVVGIVEIIAGVIVLSRWTKVGGYIVMVWLLAIAANLITTHMFYSLVLRDIEIAIAAFALAQLSSVRGGRETAGKEMASRKDSEAAVTS